MSVIARVALVLFAAAGAASADIIAVDSLSQLKSLVDESSLSSAVILRYYSGRFVYLVMFCLLSKIFNALRLQ